MIFLRGPRGLVLILVILLFCTVYYYQRLSAPVRTTKHEEAVGAPDGNIEHLKPTEEITTSSVEKSVKSTTIEAVVETQLASTPIYKPVSDNDAKHGIEAAVPTVPHAVSRADILLIVKTGTSTLWRRMPMQLTTTLADIPNYELYSDLQETLTYGVETIDVLSNISEIIRDHDKAAYSIYEDLQTDIHAYHEQAQLPGDEPEMPPGNHKGWILDRYKFLPMLTHAQEHYPNFKWYIYIEDDTFVFWDNLLQWLATLPTDDKPAYYGAYSGEINATFAQGGSGIAFSRSLMRSVFGGSNAPTLLEYANFTADSCCGDMILGKVLRDHGVLVNEGEYGPVSFRPEPPWKTSFEEFLWCIPIFTFHHLHQRDLVQLMMLERKHRQSALGSRPILFSDIFHATVTSHLLPRRDDWDNFASRYVLTNNVTTLVSTPRWPTPPTVRNATALEQAYTSPEACDAACVEVESCRMWRHEVDNEQNKSCALDTVVILGRAIEGRKYWDKREINSGWMVERIKSTLLVDQCETVVSP
ncbi:glycosyltransferase family 31 protein [Rutstroemia sp. NJR-2017a BVV2]|nr:glycosyltransferase family 31 protein [Rutstroemia sp. NJR-2017a BVV2]